MLSRGKVTPATVSYYSDEVAAGLEDYYAGRGEAVGQWVGHGSAAEGLTGEVSPDQLARLFQAVHPATGEALGAGYRVRADSDRVTGWDLTFSAPKSLSALWALGGGEIGMAAREAHDAAVAAGLEYLEEHAAFSRQGKAGTGRHAWCGSSGAGAAPTPTARPGPGPSPRSTSTPRWCSPGGRAPRPVARWASWPGRCRG